MVPRPNGATDRAPLLTVQRAAGAPSEYVEIFGRNYDVLDVDALGIRDRGHLQALFDRIVALEQGAVSGTLTAADEIEYDEKVRRAIRYVVPALDDATLADLSTTQCGELVGAFFAWRAASSGQLARTAQMISQNSSRVSPATTAEASGYSRSRST